eukprot:3681065-Pyramimonas_sp.AAC.1
MSSQFGLTGPPRCAWKSRELPCAHGGKSQITPRGPLSRIGRARKSNSSQDLHRERKDAVAVVVAISSGAVIGCAVVTFTMVTSSATIIAASTVVDVANIPRPPKSPPRTEVPAGKCPADSATAAAR